MKTTIYLEKGVIQMKTTYSGMTTGDFEKLRPDIERFFWNQAETLRNGDLSVPVETDDIDGDGAHSGNMIISQSGADFDYSVGDWEPDFPPCEYLSKSDPEHPDWLEMTRREQEQ